MEDINTPSIESENVDPNNGRIYRKMFRRILDIASKASDGISTNEYDLLNDTINGLTTAMIAKKQESTNDMVYKKTNKAIDKLEKIIDRWENSALQEADFLKLQEESRKLLRHHFRTHDHVAKISINLWNKQIYPNKFGGLK